MLPRNPEPFDSAEAPCLLATALGRSVKLMKPAPATVGGSRRSPPHCATCSRDLSRIFVALLGQNERGVGLIIAEARIGRRRQSPPRRANRLARSASEFARSVWNVCMVSAALRSCSRLARARRSRLGSSAARHSRQVDGYVAAGRERSRKFPRADFALARLSRTDAVVQKFRDRSKSPEMRLKLIFRHDEEDNEFHRRIVERVELNPFGGSAEGSHDLVQAIG